MKFVLNIWRQARRRCDGAFERHEVDDIDPEASMLEMLDVLNERIIERRRLGDRLRLRLPRGHLRLLLAADRRRPTRARAR